MSFFKDFKDDLAQAVNELIPDEELDNSEIDDDQMVNTLDDINEDPNDDPEDDSVYVIQSDNKNHEADNEMKDIFTDNSNAAEQGGDGVTYESYNDKSLESTVEEPYEADLTEEAQLLHSPSEDTPYSAFHAEETDEPHTAEVTLKESQAEAVPAEPYSSEVSWEEFKTEEILTEPLPVEFQAEEVPSEPELSLNTPYEEETAEDNLVHTELPVEPEEAVPAMEAAAGQPAAVSNSILSSSEENEPVQGMGEPVKDSNETEVEGTAVSNAGGAVMDDLNVAAAREEVTIVKKGTTITGSITSEGSLEILGTVDGDIDCFGKLIITGDVLGNSMASEVLVNARRLEGSINSEGSVTINEGSVVIGDITASSAVIAGVVKGQIDINGPITVDNKAVIKGNINAKSVQINQGAVIDGFCSLSYSEVDIDSMFEK